MRGTRRGWAAHCQGDDDSTLCLLNEAARQTAALGRLRALEAAAVLRIVQKSNCAGWLAAPAHPRPTREALLPARLAHKFRHARNVTAGVL